MRVVPGDRFAERAAQSLQRAALDLILHPVGRRDRPAVLRRDQPRDRDATVGLIDVDLRDQRAVAVVAFVEHARDAAAARARPVGRRSARGDGRVSQPAAFAAALTTSMSRGSRRCRSAVLDGIGLHACGELVHERLVREGVLQPARRAQRAGEERRADGVRQHALALHRAGAATRAADAAGDVRRRGVAAVVERGWWRRDGARRERRRLEAEQRYR